MGLLRVLRGLGRLIGGLILGLYGHHHGIEVPIAQVKRRQIGDVRIVGGVRPGLTQSRDQVLVQLFLFVHCDPLRGRPGRLRVCERGTIVPRIWGHVKNVGSA